jgi:hypothetical protein
MSAGKLRSHHIRGVLINGMTGQPAAGFQIRAVPREQAPHVIIPFAITDAQGAFDISGVPPGSYAVVSFTGLLAGQGGAEQHAAYVAIEMGNRDIENLRIVTSVPTNVQGRIAIEGRAPNESEFARGGRGAAPGIRIALTWDPDIVGMPNAGAFRNPAANATLQNDGTFAFRVGQGNYRLSISGIPPDTFVKSIRMGTTDVLYDGLRVSGPVEDPVEVVLSSSAGELRGTAVNGSTAAMPNVVVALVPESPLLRRRSDLYKSATTDAYGKFAFPVVAPGAYKLFAWEYAQPGAWQDAQFMQAYEAAGKPIRVTEGRNPEVLVTAIPVGR